MPNSASAQGFTAMVWAALFGHARLGLHGGAEASAQAERPPLPSDDAESAAPPPKEPEEPAVQKEKIIADPHPTTATESPSPAKPAPLEPADDFQLVGRDHVGSVPPTASEDAELGASKRAGRKSASDALLVAPQHSGRPLSRAHVWVGPVETAEKKTMGAIGGGGGNGGGGE